MPPGASSTIPKWVLLLAAPSCGAVFMYCLVMGSGILPIRFELLLTLGALAASPMFLPLIVFGRTRWRRRLLAAAGFVYAFYAVSFTFTPFQEAGFELAKRYGGQWAEVIVSHHAETGKWPDELAEIAAPRRPSTEVTVWPYIAGCKEGLCIWVAGYVIHHRLDSDAPRLLVGRRDIWAEWDWQERRWRTFWRKRS